MSSSSAPDSAASSNSRLATQLYWLTGLAPIATNVVTPLMVFWQMRRGDKSLMVKYNQQVNEVGRQFVSGTIGLLSYFGGGELTRGVLKALNGIGVDLGQPTRSEDGLAQDDSRQKVAMLLGGILMSFIGFAVIRPMLGTQLICKFLKKEAGVEAALSKAELDTISAEAKTKPEMDARISKKLAEVAKEGSGGTLEGFPIRQIQGWVDKHLFKADGQGHPAPLLGKTASVATLALTAWLTSLTGVLYGLNQLLGGAKLGAYSGPPPSTGLKPLASVAPQLPLAYPAGAPLRPYPGWGNMSQQPGPFRTTSL